MQKHEKYKPVVLKLSYTSASSGGSDKTDDWTLPRISDPVDVRSGLQVCVSKSYIYVQTFEMQNDRDILPAFSVLWYPEDLCLATAETRRHELQPEFPDAEQRLKH